jgi:hypothetical protein
LIVVRLLLPSNEPAPKAVDPGVASFDDPSPRSLARVRSELFRLFAAGFDVQRLVPASQEFPGIRVVVPLVSAAVLLATTRLRTRPPHAENITPRLFFRAPLAPPGSPTGPAASRSCWWRSDRLAGVAYPTLQQLQRAFGVVHVAWTIVDRQKLTGLRLVSRQWEVGLVFGVVWIGHTLCALAPGVVRRFGRRNPRFAIAVEL